MDIRIGNDIPMLWRFLTRQGSRKVDYDMTGRDLSVRLTDSQGHAMDMPFTVSGNALSFTFFGKDQRRIGNYLLTLIENAGQQGMRTIDKIKPFNLVPVQEVVMGGQIAGSVSELEVQPLVLESELSSQGVAPKPYLSMERLRPYLYRVTFDSLPDDAGGDSMIPGGCSSYVQNGKLYRNLDFKYDNAASFIVRCYDFEGMSFITGLDDGYLDDSLVAQLPYRVVDGRNNHGIMVSTHVLFNDWQWTGAGVKSIPLTRLPFLVLSRVKSMATIATDLNGVLNNLYASEGLQATGYLLQVLVTDGTTTYALLPPTEEGRGYVLQDITSNPKLANFRWVNRSTVARTDSDIQTRPTGIERFNLMPCALEDLRFTLAYEDDDRLSEFVGVDGTTKDSTDAELEAVYDLARAEYLTRQRDGKTWQTMHSVVYGSKMEQLYIQEDWMDDIIDEVGNVTDVRIDGQSVVSDRIADIYTHIHGFLAKGVLMLELTPRLSVENGTIYIRSLSASYDEINNRITI